MDYVAITTIVVLHLQQTLYTENKMADSRYREARKRCAMKTKQAAMALGVSFTTLASYERGATQPSATVIKKMAELYGVSADWLLDVERRGFQKRKEAK